MQNSQRDQNGLYGAFKRVSLERTETRVQHNRGFDIIDFQKDQVQLEISGSLFSVSAVRFSIRHNPLHYRYDLRFELTKNCRSAVSEYLVFDQSVVYLRLADNGYVQEVGAPFVSLYEIDTIHNYSQYTITTEGNVLLLMTEAPLMTPCDLCFKFSQIVGKSLRLRDRVNFRCWRHQV